MRFSFYIHYVQSNYQLVLNTVFMSVAIFIGIYMLVTKRFSTEKLDSQCAIGFFMLAFAAWLTTGYLDPHSLHNLDIAIHVFVALGFFFALQVMIRHRRERMQWNDKRERLYSKLNSARDNADHFKAVVFHVADKAPDLFNSNMLNFGRDHPEIPNFRDANKADSEPNDTTTDQQSTKKDK